MKTKANLPTYQEIFGSVQTEVIPMESTGKTVEVDPIQLRNLVLSIFNIVTVPKQFKVEHPAVTKRIFMLLMHGLDRSRYNKYYDQIKTFHELSENGYPTTILLREKHGVVSQPEVSFLGYSFTELKKFENIEEMIVSTHKLLDNNFPLPEDAEKDDFEGKHRFEQFHVQPCSKELLDQCKWLPDKVEGAKKAVALDCEMIKTRKEGSEEDMYELARLSVTDEKGSVLIDEVFKPIYPVSDLLTSVSGITQEMIDKATHVSNEGVDVLARVADKNTIIIGHGLENDFKALRLFHTRVVDTSLIYNSEPNVRYPRKPSLINLSKKYIKNNFRKDGKSHDSIDDARASFDLALHATKAAVSRVATTPKIPDLFSKIEKATTHIDVLTNSKLTPYSGVDEKVRCHLIDDDEERTTELIRCIKEEDSEVVFCHYNTMARCGTNEEEEMKAASYYNSVLERVIPIIPPASVLFIYTGGGSMARVYAIPEKQYRNAETQLCRQGLLWIKTTAPENE